MQDEWRICSSDLCHFLAALFDGLDGRVARAIGAQSAFGEQYDSLSDLLAFGVAPAMLMYSWSLHDLAVSVWHAVLLIPIKSNIADLACW